MTSVLAAAQDKTFHLDFASVNWWAFTLTLGVVLIIYGLIKKSWTGFFVWLAVLVVFTVISSVLNHLKVLSGASTKHASNLSVTLHFSQVNWWVFIIVLLLTYLVMAFRGNGNKGALHAAGILLLQALVFGFFYAVS
jgi:hypothetical protein